MNQEIYQGVTVILRTPEWLTPEVAVTVMLEVPGGVPVVGFVLRAASAAATDNQKSESDDPENGRAASGIFAARAYSHYEKSKHDSKRPRRKAPGTQAGNWNSKRTCGSRADGESGGNRRTVGSDAGR